VIYRSFLFWIEIHFDVIKEVYHTFSALDFSGQEALFLVLLVLIPLNRLLSFLGKVF
jgi:hypothetical protein